METTSRYRNEQYVSDDYAQLDRWSTHIGYKTAVQDSNSLIYTSDYGSYSSQESNHSGTTYSNLADCEEALHSPPTVAYDLPPPQFTSTMERRRDKPLPPPRMTSKVHSANKPRLLQPAKEKKISFDDSSLTVADKSHTAGDNVPSFATLPRKKKLGNTATSNATQSAPQVTWMKEVAQKADSMPRPKSASASNSSAPNKKPHGILKNKIEEQKKGDTTGYIKRNTVQRILEQQKTAKNRHSTAAAQQYKSLSSLPSQTPAESQPHKAWEYNFNGNNSSSIATAQVIGVLEPNTDGISQTYNHVKQNSAETEFEFPPPPSDNDISQLMVSGTPSSGSARSSNDFTPLKLACHRRTEANEPVRGTSNAPPAANRGIGLRSAETSNKPPVPQRPKKNITLNGNDNGNSKPRTPIENLAQKPSTRERTTSAKQPIVPPKRLSTRNMSDTAEPVTVSNSAHGSYPTINSSASQITNDIVLPPPVEFQEGSHCSPLSTQQPSYGDYELLTQDSGYQCSIHQPSVAHTLAKPHTTDQRHYHHRIAVDQLSTNMHDNLKLPPKSIKQRRPNNQVQENGYSPYYSKDISSNSSAYTGNRASKSRLVSHQHQYSTEL